LAELRGLRLSELNLAIKDALALNFDETIWVVAEVARINANYSGHAYLDLVEKRGSETLAQAKATIWRSNNRILTEYANAAGQPLRPGIQVLLLVRVDYHPVYGLSLNVQEIDPSYSLGEMARRRQEVIDRLQTEGLLDLNRRREMALVPQKIAVISSATAAGWEDFRTRLTNNPYGYGFTLTIFPSILQGDGAEASLLSTLQMIERDPSKFDAVSIIRGGGGVVDLSCFDSYLLARAIALHPLPIITGIGHERDTSVADLVAFHRAHTPTAAAEYLIALVGQFDTALSEVTDRVVNLAKSLVDNCRLELAKVTADLLGASQAKLRLSAAEFDALLHRGSAAIRARTNGHLGTITGLATRVEMRVLDYCKEPEARIFAIAGRIGTAASRRLERAGAELEQISNTVRLRDPNDVLRRGFSITRLNGRAIRSINELTPGLNVETQMHDGVVISTVRAKETA
jgi:exodeoxyribonuclease VII large subunit